MRYFRYKNTNKNLNNAFKEQYKSLTEYEKRTVRKEKCWRRLSTIISLLIFFSCMIAIRYIIKSIPQSSGLLWEVLIAIVKVILFVVLFIVSVLLTYGITCPLWKKVESFHWPTMKKEIFAKACSHLRDYYELQEPYIVTKCFDATDKNFSNHDVCIFVVGEELRITTDLIRGFLHGERDLGCYAFKWKEITLSKKQDEKHLFAELKVDNNVFLLGYRAKGFIEKNFIEKQTE